MGLAVKLVGCKPGMCAACYENRIRSSGERAVYDIDAIAGVIDAEGKREPKSTRCNAPTIHGGEPLLFPLRDLERLLAVVHKHWGQSGVQTNGVLITDAHIALFKRYNTHIGVSIDGDTAELNLGRWNAVPMPAEKIQWETDRVLANMKKCKDAGLGVSIISLLRRYNASTPEKVEAFISFLKRMRRELGIVDVRTNPVIEFENGLGEQLTPTELGEAFIKISDYALSDPLLAILPYHDVINLLFGSKNATCNFSACDPWKTTAEQPIFEDGSVGCCLKVITSQDGLQAVAADTYSDERYIVLRQVPMDENGCRDCRFWFMCKGGCCGEGADNDWRNKSRFCLAWTMLFEHLYGKIKGAIPNLLMAPDFYPSDVDAEAVMNSILGGTWEKQHRKKPADLLSGKAKENKRSAAGHGDAPHGNSHGDHTDAGAR
jgi:uncharacterized protein